MNKNTAARRGYEHTGHFAWGYERETLKPKLEEYRKAGYKAIIVSIPPDPLSRGHHGTSYAIMVEPRYAVDQRVKAAKAEIDRYEDSISRILEHHLGNALKEVEKTREKQRENARWLANNGHASDEVKEILSQAEKTAEEQAFSNHLELIEKVREILEEIGGSI